MQASDATQLALAGLSDPRLFTFLDLAGTFAFAVSGAVAARDRGLDWFGILFVAFTVACGGGVLRDLCIGAVPPVGLSDWRYLAVASTAAILTTAAKPLVVRLAHPVIRLDSVGRGMFAVTGAQKAILVGYNAEVAVIYAAAALVAAVIKVAGHLLGWTSSWRTWTPCRRVSRCAISRCTTAGTCLARQGATTSDDRSAGRADERSAAPAREPPGRRIAAWREGVERCFRE